MENPTHHSQPSQSTNRDSSHNFNSNNGTIDLEKFKSLELRLMGCMRTIKTLEKENQAKQDKIQSLQIELDKKNKTIEGMKTEQTTLINS